MKKIFFLFQSMFAVTLCFSQSTLIRNNFPVLGEYVQEAGGDTTGIYQGQASANQLCDFSSLTITYSSNYTYADTLFYNCNGAGSNLYKHKLPFNANNVFSYGYFDDSTKLELICRGGFSTPPFTSENYSYPDRRTLMMFPFNYNDSFVDSFHYSGIYSYPGNTTSYRTYGVDSLFYDAWGTLILPIGTFPFIRIRTITHTVDTTTTTNIGGQTTYASTNYSEEFAFYTSSNYIIKITYNNYNPSSKKVYVIIRNLPTNVPTITHENKLNIFPNPASTEFQISNFNFQTNDEILLRDVLGKIYFTKKISSPTSNLKLQTSNFSDGIYFLEVKTKEGVMNKKVVVQH